jgi:prepilin-type N-terminal cleavage/methylation domain-containing protein
MRRSPGFSLVETLAVLSLAGVVAGMSTMGLAELVRGARLAGAARALGASLRLARGQALAGFGPVVARFDAGRGTYQILDDGGGLLAEHALPPGVAFAGLPARARITFGALGTADNATVALAAGPRSRRVVVNQRGRIRIT